jgi:hypothetical protein
MTLSSRRSHIEKALAEYREEPAGSGETTRVPFRGSSTVLKVIEVPLDIPILNADSFRIAPELADHPGRQTVLDDPESDAAQQIVADLVRASHRNADALKESLLIDGQDTPGVITREGKLINANTRCVLLRDLVADGLMPAASLRVAVLPSDITNSEVLGLESVLQQQQEFKDEYTLVSKLMMIEKLHAEGGMSDRQIAASLREKKGAERIADLREVLVLMERARRLTSTPRPLSAFISKKDQTQNWLELLYQVREVDRLRGRLAGNEVIRAWLIAFYAEFDSVHQLRNVRGGGDWIQRDVLPLLRDGDATAAQVAAAIDAAGSDDPASEDRFERASRLGLDLLTGSDEKPTSTITHKPDPAVQALLDLVSVIGSEPEGVVELPSGIEVAADEVKSAVQRSVEEGIKAVRRRTAGANKLQRPQTLTASAAQGLRTAAEVLDEVLSEPEFAILAPALAEAIAETQQALDDLAVLLASRNDASGVVDAAEYNS